MLKLQFTSSCTLIDFTRKIVKQKEQGVFSKIVQSNIRKLSPDHNISQILWRYLKCRSNNSYNKLQNNSMRTMSTIITFTSKSRALQGADAHGPPNVGYQSLNQKIMLKCVTVSKLTISIHPKTS